MKINPINNSDKTAFKGLWGVPNEKVTSIDEYCIAKHIENLYYPFKGESPSDIKRAMEWKNFKTTCPTENDFVYLHITSEGKKAKTLGFLEKEFNAYKSFYGKELPEKFKNIEKELIENNLQKYLNGGLVYKIKQFLHNIKF